VAQKDLESFVNGRANRPPDALENEALQKGE
jgi:hypothetical protein